MVFYVNKIRKLEELRGPTVLFLTDRNDLDQQLHKTFLRTGYPTAKQAESIKGLEDKIRGAGAEILFTTIQKFELKEPLSRRDNFIVIADEAHRSQYAEFAGNIRTVLPNALFMGITGTPIEFNNRNTRLVFGDYISEYPIDRSVEDKVTVPIYYEGRLVPLHVVNEFIDEDLDQLGATSDHSQNITEELKRKWAKLEQVVGSEDRINKIASDIVYHFNNRGVEGKAMIVTMSRNIAVDMYRRISNIKNAPEIAVVISSNKEYEDQIQKEVDNKEIEKRFKNPDDPLKMVIVCDMWLTGFDVPCLQTIYLDKPLKGHSLMQAVARVNRRYKDKEGGLIVDYIGIAENLKKALAIYTSDIQKQALIPIEEIIKKLLEYYGKVKAFFVDLEYQNWKELSAGERASFFSKDLDVILSKNQKKEYLELSGRLYKLFALVMPHKEANNIRDDVEFFEGVRRGIIKNTIVDPIYIDKKSESAIRDLISKNITAEGVIDIFAQYRKGKPNISILDEKFLEEVKNSRFKNLTIEAVHKLFEDELRQRGKFNILRYKTLLEKLEEIIEEYENNIINSSKVIERLIELAREIRAAEHAGEGLGLTSEEMAFYDALSQGKVAMKDQKIKELVREIVKSVRRDLQIDWSSQEVTKARMRTDIRLLLLQHDYPFDEVDEITKRIFEQAFSLYRDYQPVFAQQGIN